MGYIYNKLVRFPNLLVTYTLHHPDASQASQPGLIEYVVVIHNSFVAIALVSVPCTSCTSCATQLTEKT